MAGEERNSKMTIGERLTGRGAKIAGVAAGSLDEGETSLGAPPVNPAGKRWERVAHQLAHPFDNVGRDAERHFEFKGELLYDICVKAHTGHAKKISADSIRLISGRQSIS